MKKYLLAATLLLGSVVRPTHYKVPLTHIATISAIASIIGASVIIDGDDDKNNENDKKGVKIAFAGASLATLIGILSNNNNDGLKVTKSCIAGFGPAVGIMMVAKFLKNMTKKNKSTKHAAHSAH